MDLLEHQGKQLYKDYKLPSARSVLVHTPQEAGKAAQQFPQSVLKAQIPIGHRKKLGAIVMVTPKTAENAAAKLFKKVVKGHPIKALLVEEFTQIAEEWYLSLSIDRIERCISLLFSTSGGIDIESVPKSRLLTVPYPLSAHAQAELKSLVAPASKKYGVDLFSQLEEILEILGKLMVERDALLVEVNPLAIMPDGKLLLLDSKITIDDAALFRQQFPKVESADPLQKEAQTVGVAYVPLDGSIGIIGNGAGLVMATLDMVAQFGGKAANFLDVGGGADHDKMEAALTIVLKQPSVRAVLINIFGGITRTDEIARGIEQFKQKQEIKVPVVVRLVGTKKVEAREILKRINIVALDEMEQAVEQVVQLAGASKKGSA